MTDRAATRFFGRRVPRIEDPALLRGRGRFADDLVLPLMLQGCFVRSPIAHARIRAIDVAAARALAGVHAVFTAADFAPHLATERVPVAMPAAAIRHQLEPRVLARDEVCHVGEAIALVVAESRPIAEDAAALVAVDLEPLPVVGDVRGALARGAPRARLDCADNLLASLRVGYGDCDAAFAQAAHRFREKFWQHKGGGHSIECRGIVASFDPNEDLLTVWDGTQMPHRAKAILVQALGLAEHQIRVIAPDVGGGFGPKFVFYPEEVAIPLAAHLLGRPVKWIEDRFESFTATTQERDQYWDVEIAVDGAGRLLGIRGSLLHDHGAYTPYGIAIPQNSATNLLGPYVLPSYALDIQLALTNKVPSTPTRGAGRPQGTFVMERLLDRVARELGLDRAELRRRNLIQPASMPYVTPLVTRDGGQMTYDSGDYPACQALALERADYEGFARRAAEARAAGRYRGIGIANYVEGTGRGPFEAATVRVGPSGKVVVATGATAQGQGTKTMLAQLCAEQLGIALEDVTVIAGDTASSTLGLGAFASRQAVTAGNAVHLAAEAVRRQALEAAASLLEAPIADLVLVGGRVEIAGAPGSGLALGAIAQTLLGMPGHALPRGAKPGLEASLVFEPSGLTYCNGTHVAELEVDVATGAVTILRYVVVHDSGRLINPLLVEGQIYGGVVHGIGNALFEWMGYDDQAQPLTVTYADYLLPSAPSIPRIEILHIETPTPLNPLGVKGAGESGTIAATAAIAAAVEHALAPFGVRIAEIPITPMRLVELIEQGAP